MAAIKEAIKQGRVIPDRSFKVFQTLRQELGIHEDEHWAVLDKLSQESPECSLAEVNQRFRNMSEWTQINQPS